MPFQRRAVPRKLARDEPLELSRAARKNRLELALRLEHQSVEAGFARLEQDLLLAPGGRLSARGEVVAASAHFYGSRSRAPVERGGLVEANLHEVERAMDAEQHCSELLRSHLDEAITSKAQQGNDLLGDLVIVASERDATRPPSRCEIEAEGEVEMDALLALPLERANAHDAIDFEPGDSDEVVGHDSAEVWV